MSDSFMTANSSSRFLSVKNANFTKASYYPWLVWGLGAAFFFFEYIARVSPGVMVKDLMRDFNVGAYALGGLSVYFYYAYLGLQMPVGILVDRFGVHRLLTAMALLTGFGCILFGSATTVPVATAARFLMGFGAAFAFVSTLKLVSIWFPASRVGLLSGLTQAIGMLGAAVGEAPTSLLVGALGWRYSMGVMAIVFVVLALLIGLIVRDKKQSTHYAAHHIETPHDPHQAFNSLKRLIFVLSNKQTWFNALYAGLLFAPTAAFAELWGVAFFERTYNFSTHIAASAVGLIFIGWGIGGPMIGWLSDWIGRRKPVLIGSAVTGCLLMGAVLYIPNIPTPLLFLLLFLYGVSNTGVAIAYALAAELNPRSMAGTSLGFTNMASVIVGAMFQPLIGKFLDLQTDTRIVDGIPFYTEHSFRLAMTVLPICLALSIVLAFFVRETYCRSITESSTDH